VIGYVTLGTDDLDRARGFYDDLFGSIGASRLMEMASGFTLYARGWGQPGVAVTRPYDGQAASAGNGNAQVALSPGQG
jgi:catechol 2,3-dioxygenase-like lactoylglutathione lyase family enzyme